MEVLLNNDVFIEFFQEDSEHHDDIKRLQVMHMLGDVDLWVSVKTVTDVAHELAQSYPWADVQNALDACLAFMKICSMDGNDLTIALDRRWDNLDNCVVEVAAERIKVDFIITGNTEGFAKSKTIAVTPSEFFDLIANVHQVRYEDIDW